MEPDQISPSCSFPRLLPRVAGLTVDMPAKSPKEPLLMLNHPLHPAHTTSLPTTLVLSMALNNKKSPAPTP